ncbi:MAG: integrase core domain-containing protein [Pseudomonadota bacterium]
MGDWIMFYNNRRPHQSLKMKTPAEAYALAA